MKCFLYVNSVSGLCLRLRDTALNLNLPFDLCRWLIEGEDVEGVHEGVHDGFYDPLCHGHRRDICDMGDSGPVHEVGTFSSCADDLHIGEILSVVHSRDSSATWSTSTHSVG